MADPKLDQFMNALIWKSVLPSSLWNCAVCYANPRWLESKATRAGRRARQARAGPSSSLRSASSSRSNPNQLPCRRSRNASLTLDEVTGKTSSAAGEIFRRKGFEVEIVRREQTATDLTLPQGEMA